MLIELRINNFAIIESLSLPLAQHFNVLTGETGAGKSIIVGALGLLLGERASGDVIRTGADKASVEGVFDVASQPRVAALCDERGIDLSDDTVVLKREVSASGRARAWANGTTVTATVLADIGRLLVNLHGQHEAQSLLSPNAQREMLDAFGGAGERAVRVRDAFAALGAARRERESLVTRRDQAARRADYLRHVAQEIDSAKLATGEDGRLEDEAHRLTHADELRSLAASIAAALEGSGDTGTGDGVLPRLAAVQRSLAALQRIDASLARLQELFDNAFYALEELARELGAYAQSIDLDPERLADVQQRRDLLFRLMKKYGPSLEDVISAGHRAKSELDLIDTAALDLRQLAARETAAAEQLARETAELTAVRQAAAQRLATAVDAVLPDLGLPDGHFSVALTPRTDIGEDGAEDVEFRVALNVGHESRPLARVASGGELSRIMLALKTILTRLDHIPTLVFDEVDAGIGGKVGLQVGETLRRLAAHHQVFAITHLPQIAARAHHHILVSKGARAGVTTADVHVLDGDDRVVEVARMLGGDPESDTSRRHARELLAVAGEGARSGQR
jgi:DNA repair protein RecN (Recombination protein N)